MMMMALALTLMNLFSTFVSILSDWRQINITQVYGNEFDRVRHINDICIFISSNCLYIPMSHVNMHCVCSVLEKIFQCRRDAFSFFPYINICFVRCRSYSTDRQTMCIQIYIHKSKSTNSKDQNLNVSNFVHLQPSTSVSELTPNKLNDSVGESPEIFLTPHVCKVFFAAFTIGVIKTK